MVQIGNFMKSTCFSLKKLPHFPQETKLMGKVWNMGKFQRVTETPAQLFAENDATIS